MDSLSITITDKRQIDGLINAANAALKSPEDFLLNIVAEQGKRYADYYFVAIITSSAFVARFTPQEYASIIAAQDSHPEVKDMLDLLYATSNVYLDDPRIPEALNTLVQLNLLDASRPEQILYFERAVPADLPPPEVNPNPDVEV